MIRPVSLLFILVLCLSGYVLLTRTHFKYHQLRRSSGYHTFLLSCGAGLLLFIFAIFMHYVGQLIFLYTGFSVSFAEWILGDVFRMEVPFADVVLFDVSILVGLLSIFIPTAYYCGSESKFYKALLSEYQNDPENSEYTELFFRSWYHGLPILFTLSDRKVFIGYVPKIHYHDFNDIHIRPIYSGYRDKDTLQLRLVTPYKDVMDKLSLNGEVFMVTLPLREIMHAHLYNFEYQDSFDLKEQGFQKNNEATITDTTYDGSSLEGINNYLKSKN